MANKESQAALTLSRIAVTIQYVKEAERMLNNAVLEVMRHMETPHEDNGVPTDIRTIDADEIYEPRWIAKLNHVEKTLQKALMRLQGAQIAATHEYNLKLEEKLKREHKI